MKRNGKPRPPDFELEIDFERQARQCAMPVRAALHAWLRRWKSKPERTFWEIGPTGEWRKL